MNSDIRNKHSSIGLSFSDILLSSNITTNLSVQNTYFHLESSLSQELRQSLSGSSALGAHKAAIKEPVSSVVTSEVQIGKICSQDHRIVSRIAFLTGCQMDYLKILAGCQLKADFSPCHGTLSIWQLRA